MHEEVLFVGRHEHHRTYGKLVEEGLRCFGVKTRWIDYEQHQLPPDSLVVCWGWRIGQEYRRAKFNVLVMERGYIGDREAYTSLGFNGLNGRAQWPTLPENLYRLDAHAALVSEPRVSPSLSRAYMLLVGQVHGDASLNGKDLLPWYAAKAIELKKKYGLPVMFRPHPLDKSRLFNYIGAMPEVDVLNFGSLDSALSSTAGVVCYNSNTAVNATLRGIPISVEDEGSMLFEYAKPLFDGEFDNVKRLAALNRIACRQWSKEELRAGLPWRIFGTPAEILT